MQNLKKALVWYLAAAVFILGVTPRCFAGFSPSEVIALNQGERSTDLEKVQKFLETKMVRERLKELGYTPEEIGVKLASLGNRQIHELALRLDEMKVAGDGGEVLVIVLLVAILIVVIIYATGHKFILK